MHYLKACLTGVECKTTLRRPKIVCVLPVPGGPCIIIEWLVEIIRSTDKIKSSVTDKKSNCSWTTSIKIVFSPRYRYPISYALKCVHKNHLTRTRKVPV